MKKQINPEDNIFIWPHQGILKATSSNEWPSEIVLDNSIYVPIPGGDDWTDFIFWNSLRNEQKQLVGFEMHILESEEITRNEFFLGTKGVWFSRGGLRLIIQETDKYEEECVEGFPVLFYQDQQRNLLIGIHHFGSWGELAFDLEVEFAPVPR